MILNHKLPNVAFTFLGPMEPPPTPLAHSVNMWEQAMLWTPFPLLELFVSLEYSSQYRSCQHCQNMHDVVVSRRNNDLYPDTLTRQFVGSKFRETCKNSGFLIKHNVWTQSLRFPRASTLEPKKITVLLFKLASKRWINIIEPMHDVSPSKYTWTQEKPVL
jgi:hypothetical protein